MGAGGGASPAAGAASSTAAGSGVAEASSTRTIDLPPETTVTTRVSSRYPSRVIVTWSSPGTSMATSTGALPVISPST